MLPINPGLAGGAILGLPVYASLPKRPDRSTWSTSSAIPRRRAPIVDEALALDPLPKVIWMQLGVRNDAAAARAEAKGVQVVMNRCPKIEYGRLSGEIGWSGVNSRIISARKPTAGAGFQRLTSPIGAAHSRSLRRAVSFDCLAASSPRYRAATAYEPYASSAVRRGRERSREPSRSSAVKSSRSA